MPVVMQVQATEEQVRAVCRVYAGAAGFAD